MDEYSSAREAEATTLVVMKPTESCEMLHSLFSTPFTVTALRNKIMRDGLTEESLFHIDFISLSLKTAWLHETSTLISAPFARSMIEPII
jgi:hypothetical protein